MYDVVAEIDEKLDGSSTWMVYLLFERVLVKLKSFDNSIRHDTKS